MNNGIKKIINRIKIKHEKNLLYKNMKLKEDIKQLRKVNNELKNMNHKLIDQITLKNIKIRELDLTNRTEGRTLKC